MGAGRAHLLQPRGPLLRARPPLLPSLSACAPGEPNDIPLRLLRAVAVPRPRLGARLRPAGTLALGGRPSLGFEIFVLSAPMPFVRSEAEALKRAARDVVARHFPDAPELYARRGWQLPMSIGRVYDTGRIERVLGFRCATSFASVWDALRTGGNLPFAHDPDYPIAERRDAR
jgi:hypothetical protein